MSFEKQKAIFLDRDGVLSQERGDYTWLLEDLKINPGVVEALTNFSKQRLYKPECQVFPRMGKHL